MATSDVQQRPPSEKSTVELGGDLARQMAALVHHEVELAAAELSEKGKRAGIGAGMFGAAGVAGLLAAGCLTACAIAAVHLVLALWLAALVVGALYGAAAGVLLVAGRGQVRRATPPVPSQAVESAKEDVEWLKTQARSARR